MNGLVVVLLMFAIGVPLTYALGEWALSDRNMPEGTDDGYPTSNVRVTNKGEK